MVANATSLLAEYTKAMSFIYVDRSIVFLLESYDFWEIGQVAFHREYTIYYNQLYRIRGTFLQLFLQRFHIVVLILQLSGK